MRTNRTLDKLRTALLVAPFLAGACGNNDSVGPGTGTTVTLPDCPDGNLLVLNPDTTSPNLVLCQTPPVSSLIAPPCSMTQALTSDGHTLTCVDKGSGTTSPGTVTLINTTQTAINTLNNAVNNINITNTPPSNYLGNTAGTFTGGFSVAGTDPGIASAAKLCQVNFPGAHMCTAYEMFYSARSLNNPAGLLNANVSVNKAWIWMPTWHNPGPAAVADPAPGTYTSLDSASVNILEGTGDTCGSYTDSGIANHWAGAAIQWTTLRTTNVSFRYLGGGQAPCNVALPIACCK